MFEYDDHGSMSRPRHVLWAQTLGANLPVDNTSSPVNEEDFHERRGEIARQNALHKKQARRAEKSADLFPNELRRLDAEIASLHQGHREVWADTQIWKQEQWVVQQKIQELEVRAQMRTDEAIRQDIQVHALQEQLEHARYHAECSQSKYAYDLEHLEAEASSQMTFLHSTEQNAEMSLQSGALEERVAAELHAHMHAEVRETEAECAQQETRNRGLKERIRGLHAELLRQEHAAKETLRKEIERYDETRLKALQADLKKASRELRASAFELQNFRAVLADPVLHQHPAIVELLEPVLRGLDL